MRSSEPRYPVGTKVKITDGPNGGLFPGVGAEGWIVQYESLQDTYIVKMENVGSWRIRASWLEKV